MRLRLTACALSLIALMAAAFTGCGGSSSTGTNADPAGVVPARAAVYLGAVVRPDGSLETEALAAGRKLTQRSNPYRGLVAVLQTPGSPTLDYAHDVAPWLGRNAGLFFTALGSSSAAESLLGRVLTGGITGTATSGQWPFGNGGAGAAGGAIVLDTSDLDKAKSFLASAASHAGAHASSYRGVSYETNGSAAFAVVDRLVVLGTEGAVHEVIDTTQGGASLSGQPSYTQLAAVAPSDALAHVFGNPVALSGGKGKTSGRDLPALLTLLGGGSPLNVSVVPTASSVSLDADVAPGTGATGGGQGGRSGGLIRAAASGGRAFGELPGDAWLAVGLGDLGVASGGGVQGLQALVTLAHTLASSAGGEAASSQVTVSVPGVIEGLTAPLQAILSSGAQAQRDFLSWMGEAGIFASGTSVLDLKGAIAIASDDATASRAAVAKLGSALGNAGGEASPTTIPGTEAALEAKVTGLPITLAIAAGRDAQGEPKFVIGLSPTSVQEALHPQSTISGSAVATAAAGALGAGTQPTISVSITSLVSFLEGVGLNEDPSITPLLPALRAASTLSGGGKQLSGGIERLALVLGLQPSTH